MDDSNKNIIFLLGGFLLKELFDIVKTKLSKENEKRDESIDENTDALKKLELAITTLQVELKFVLGRLESIPKIEKDVNEAHAKIRLMEQGNGK